jgi:hypothetical protein
VKYFRKKSASAQERRMAFQLFCERPMKITPEQFRYLLEEDLWALSSKPSKSAAPCTPSEVKRPTEE